MDDSPQTCDIAVLTVIGPELLAALRVFGLSSIADRKRWDGALYWRVTVFSLVANREVVVVIHAIGQSGIDEAQGRATWLRAHFQPAAIVLAGIAAGRKEKLRIGDVVYSRGTLDTSRKVAVNGEIKLRTTGFEMPFQMRQMMVAMELDDARFQSLVAEAMGDRFELLKQQSEKDSGVNLHPEIKDGEGVSDNLLLRDASVLENLAHNVNQGIKIGDMESSGVARACAQGLHPIPYLIIRGISDFGDTTKSSSYHEWASSTAAAFARLFVERGFDIDQLRPASGFGNLERLEQLTQLGTLDASLIQHATARDSEIHLAEVYTTRKVEGEILDTLHQQLVKKKMTPPNPSQ